MSSGVGVGGKRPSSGRSSPSKRGAGQTPPRPGSQAAAAQILPTGQDYNEYMDDIKTQIEAHRKTPMFNYQHTSGLGTGTVLIGAKGLGERVCADLKDLGVHVVRRPCSGLKKEALEIGFRNALETVPCALIMTEFELIPQERLSLLCQKIKEMQALGYYIVTICTTDDKNFVLTADMAPGLKVKALEEAETGAAGP